MIEIIFVTVHLKETFKNILSLLLFYFIIPYITTYVYNLFHLSTINR